MIFCSVVRLVVAPTADVDPESALLTACFSLFPSNHFLKLLCSEILEEARSNPTASRRISEEGPA
jgi:hypothetical protein